MMSKLDADIEKAITDFNYYLRNRQKHLDNPKKLTYYSERLIIKEENLVKLLMQQREKEKQNEQ